MQNFGDEHADVGPGVGLGVLSVGVRASTVCDWGRPNLCSQGFKVALVHLAGTLVVDTPVDAYADRSHTVSIWAHTIFFHMFDRACARLRE